MTVPKSFRLFCLLFFFLLIGLVFAAKHPAVKSAVVSLVEDRSTTDSAGKFEWLKSASPSPTPTPELTHDLVAAYYDVVEFSECKTAFEQQRHTAY